MDGQTECKKCGIGTYMWNKGAFVCIECEVGRYTDLEGQVSCKKCKRSEGLYTPGVGSTSCSLCPVGTDRYDSWGTSCRNCSPGSFADREGTEYCTSCNLGKYTNTTGSTECTDCPPGTYAPTRGQDQCTLCEAGSFTDKPAQINCTLCPSGTEAPEPGSSKCVPVEEESIGEKLSGSVAFSVYGFIAGLLLAYIILMFVKHRRTSKAGSGSSTALASSFSDYLHLLIFCFPFLTSFLLSLMFVSPCFFILSSLHPSLSEPASLALSLSLSDIILPQRIWHNKFHLAANIWRPNGANKSFKPCRFVFVGSYKELCQTCCVRSLSTLRLKLTTAQRPDGVLYSSGLSHETFFPLGGKEFGFAVNL